MLDWRLAGPGVSALATAEGTVFAGARYFFPAGDAGSVSFPWLSDAGFPVDLEERPVLMGQGAGLALYRECVSPVTSCLEIDKATWGQAFSLIDGQFLWKVKVLPAGAPAHLEEVVLTGLRPGAFGALVQESFDGGAQAFLEAFADGKRVLNCPFPEGTLLGGAVFSSGNLHALVNRDAGWLLETYDLANAPLLTSGWPQADGLSGTRRAR